NKSTVPIGSGNWVDLILRESFERAHGRRVDAEFSVASNPEFLREGSAIHDTLYPDRIVIGSDNERSLAVLNRLYRPILDQSFTAAEYNHDMPIVKAAREVNQRQRDAVVERLLAELRILKGRKVGLLGLAFKPQTDDLRDAPAIDIARLLVERGARVKLHDPVA